MSNEATITIIETDDGLEITMTASPPTEDNQAFKAAARMVDTITSNAEFTCQGHAKFLGAEGEVLGEADIDL